MPTNVEDNGAIPKIRTFAADLDAVRRERGMPVKEKKEVKPTPEPTPHKHVLQRATEAQEVSPAPEPKHEHKQLHKAPQPAPEKRTEEKSERPLPHIEKKDVEAVATTEKKSLFKDEEKSVRVEGNKASFDTSTVVTDTKHDRFKLFPSLFSSIGDWFSHLKDRLSGKKRPKYTVSGSYRKKGVLSNETVSSAKTMVDHEAAIKRIRKHGDEDKEKKQPSQTPQKGVLLLEAPEDEQEKKTVIIEERKTVANERKSEVSEKEAELKEREAALAKAEAEVAELKEKANQEADRLRNEANDSNEAERAEIEALKEKAVAQAQAAAAEAQEAAAAVKEAQERAAAAAAFIDAPLEEGALPPDERSWRERLTDTNVATLITVVSIAGVALLFFVGMGYYQDNKLPNQSPTIELPQLIGSESTSLSVAGLTAEQVRTTISDNGSPVFQINFTAFNQNGEVVPATAPAINSALGWRADPSFLNSLEQLSLGGFSGTFGFAIIKSTDYETALGGMLNWEPFLQTDINRLQAGTTNTGNTESIFNDVTFGDISARESTAQSSNQVVWGFIDDTTILIAPNRFVFGQLLERF